MSIIDANNPQELSGLFNENILKKEIYVEALSVVRKNSSGKIWLIGSGVYKTFLNLLYGDHYTIKDWDFIVEKINKPLELEKGWLVGETKFGNPKLEKNKFVIDLIALDNVHSIKARNLEPNIENYLSGVPLTVQSIAFSIDERSLIGDVGIDSLLTKTVGINNRDEYDYSRSVYGDIYNIKRYADNLGFKEI